MQVIGQVLDYSTVHIFFSLILHLHFRKVKTVVNSSLKSRDIECTVLIPAVVLFYFKVEEHWGQHDATCYYCTFS